MNDTTPRTMGDDNDNDSAQRTTHLQPHRARSLLSPTYSEQTPLGLSASQLKSSACQMSSPSPSRVRVESEKITRSLGLSDQTPHGPSRFAWTPSESEYFPYINIIMITNQLKIN